MDWIKRNLFFVIGAVVALILMVGAGFYTWTGWSNNSKALEEVNAKYEELKRLINLNPNPGSGKVDNIKLAKEQQAQMVDVIGKVTARFQAIPTIPANADTNVTAEAFASGLSTTLHRLQAEATNAGILIPPRYNFSFEKQSAAVRFSGSVYPLAVQLGEVSTIANILIASKINSLDSIQRERVSPDDSVGPATDYLDRPSETNELAVLSPYQLSFRCFTPELALVLANFSGSAHGFIVKSINVEPAPAVFSTEATMVYTPTTQLYQPAPVNPAFPPRGGKDSDAAFRERYGIGNRQPTPVQPTPQYVVPTLAAPVSSVPKTVLDEKQLKVTMIVQVVKLLPKK